ncbi:MAG: Arginyl-tRNA--protein transferase 1 [Phylliscum demangeonii]|nr:MAG: Arginyl-tRNA--protein transferase 1 [Phylliscum demangeonii]
MHAPCLQLAVDVVHRVRAAYYARADVLTALHYQNLLDRGWRRSGSLLYKPDLRNSCCPHYTIRFANLDASTFVSSRDQRQTLNRWNRFVLGDDYHHQAKTLYPLSRAEKARSRNDFRLCESIHECEYARVKRPPEPAHRFEITLEATDFTEEKYRLFEDYQRNVHHEPPQKISRGGFRRFLCETPLQRITVARSDGLGSHAVGSYHQCYRLDGKLVAIGVLDLLPQCVSAVYFMYHQSVSTWSLGKVGALQEAALAVEGGYRYYYMGFYIHSCVKMRYKRSYAPQFVLDPEQYTWHPLDDRLAKMLDTTPYISPARGALLEATVAGDEDDNQTVLSALFRSLMPGIPAPKQLLSEVDLGRVKIRIGSIEAEARNLNGVNQTNPRDKHRTSRATHSCRRPTMCIVIFGNTTWCGHTFVYRTPEGECPVPDPRPERSCRDGWQADLDGPCERCLDAFDSQQRAVVFAALIKVQNLLPLQTPAPVARHEQDFERAVHEARTAIAEFEDIYTRYGAAVQSFVAFIRACYQSVDGQRIFRGYPAPEWPPSHAHGCPAVRNTPTFWAQLRILELDRDQSTGRPPPGGAASWDLPAGPRRILGAMALEPPASTSSADTAPAPVAVPTARRRGAPPQTRPPNLPPIPRLRPRHGFCEAFVDLVTIQPDRGFDFYPAAGPGRGRGFGPRPAPGPRALSRPGPGSGPGSGPSSLSGDGKIAWARWCGRSA